MTIEPRTELRQLNDRYAELADKFGEDCWDCRRLKDELRQAEYIAASYTNPDGALCPISLAIVINSIHQRLDQLEWAQQ